MVGICHVHRQRITESRNCLSERNAVLAEIRFCLFWIPLEIVTHESILPFSIEILHWHNYVYLVLYSTLLFLYSKVLVAATSIAFTMRTMVCKVSGDGANPQRLKLASV